MKTLTLTITYLPGAGYELRHLDLTRFAASDDTMALGDMIREQLGEFGREPSEAEVESLHSALTELEG